VHGTKHLGKELLNNIRIIQSTKVLEVSLLNKFMKRAGNNQNVDTCNNKKLSVDVLSHQENAIVAAEGFLNYEIYDRIKVKGVVFTSRNYDSNVKRSNSFIQFQKPDKSIQYGEILHFIKDLSCEQFLAIVTLFKIQQTSLFFLEESLCTVPHLLPVEYAETMILVPVSDILTKVIKAGNYLCLRPNKYEVNL